MNVRKLRKLIKWIKAEPRRFDMQSWVGTAEKTADLNPPCGTVGCLAGMACHMEGFRLANDHSGQHAVSESEDRHVGGMAAEILGLDEEQSERLFYVSFFHTADDHWPTKYEKQYLGAKTQQGRVGAAVRRIEHFIKTKGAE